MPRLLQALKPLAWPLALAALFAAIYLARIHHEMVDFEVYRTAAIRAADAAPLYRADDGHYQYKYLPAFALAMWPFGRVPDQMARLVWFALSCGLLVAFVRWSVRSLPERRLREGLLIGLAVLFTAKFYAREITLGQSNILLGVLLLGGLLAAQTDARRTAGVLIGLGVFVKVYAAILLPWLLLAAGLPAVAAAAAVLAVGLVLPAVVYGWQGNLDLLAAWYGTVTETTAPNLLNPENVSAAAMWTKWIGAGDTAMWLAAATGVAALALVAVAVWRRDRISDPLYLEFGLLMLLVPILSPQGWDYVLLLATPAIVCLADRWRETTLPWRALAAAAIVITSFTVFDLLGRQFYAWLMNISVMSVAVLALAACLVNVRVRGLA